MARGRWYPSATSLHNERILLLGGKLEDGGIDDDIEVLNDGAITKGGTRLMTAYPHMFFMPNGNVLIAGTGTEDSFYMRPSKNLSVHQLPKMWARGVRGRGRSGTLLPGPPSGCTKVLVAGGGTPADGGSTVEVFDTAAASPTWVRKSPLPEERTHMNVVILPDGQLLGKAESMHRCDEDVAHVRPRRRRLASACGAVVPAGASLDGCSCRTAE